MFTIIDSACLKPNFLSNLILEKQNKYLKHGNTKLAHG